MNHLIAPSVLASDFLKLGNETELLNRSEADWIHLDVMDGRFVPNISFGLPVVEAVKKIAKKPLDVHLMIVEPDKYIQRFVDAGADILSFHLEADHHVHRTLNAIKEAGAKPAISINPHTSVELLQPVIRDIYMVNIMTVNPGFGGQSFIKNSIEKIRRLKEIIVENNSGTLIEIDGGVTNKNAKEILQAGADVLVAGSSVFKAEDPEEMIRSLKSISTDTLEV